jgi:hypothetical protein
MTTERPARGPVARELSGLILGLLVLLMLLATALMTLTATASTLSGGPPMHPTQSHIPPTRPTDPGGGGDPGIGSGSISGHVVIDANHNGVADLGEIAFGGATVVLDNGGSLRFTVITDGNGVYGFNSLGDATWTLTLLVPPGYAATSPAVVPDLSTDGGQRLVVDFGIVEGQAAGTATPAAGTSATRRAGTPGATLSPSPSVTATAGETGTATPSATPFPTAVPVDVEATVRVAVQATVAIAQSLQTGVAAVTASAAAPSPEGTGTPPARAAAGVFSDEVVIGSWLFFGTVTLLALGVAIGAVGVAGVSVRRDGR